jgi:hypothetical protein
VCDFSYEHVSEQLVVSNQAQLKLRTMARLRDSNHDNEQGKRKKNRTILAACMYQCNRVIYKPLWIIYSSFINICHASKSKRARTLSFVSPISSHTTTSPVSISISARGEAAVEAL